MRCCGIIHDDDYGGLEVYLSFKKIMFANGTGGLRVSKVLFVNC